MPGAEHGMQRAVGMVVEAVVVAALFSTMIETGLVPKIYFTLANIISIVALVFLIDKSRYWSFGYLAGWVIGLAISLPTLMQTEFLGIFDFLIYGLTAAGAIGLRIKIHTR